MQGGNVHKLPWCVPKNNEIIPYLIYSRRPAHHDNLIATIGFVRKAPKRKATTVFGPFVSLTCHVTYTCQVASLLVGAQAVRYYWTQ